MTRLIWKIKYTLYMHKRFAGLYSWKYCWNTAKSQIDNAHYHWENTKPSYAVTRLSGRCRTSKDNMPINPDNWGNDFFNELDRRKSISHIAELEPTEDKLKVEWHLNVPEDQPDTGRFIYLYPTNLNSFSVMRFNAEYSMRLKSYWTHWAYIEQPETPENK